MSKDSAQSLYEELRKRAEGIIRYLDEGPNPYSDWDILKLIHELEVHQAELLIQNEELRHSRMELEESRRAFSDLYDHAPIGYVSLTGKGVIARANLAASKMLRRERNKLTGMGFSHFVHPRDHGTYYALINEASMRGGARQAELRLLKGTVPFWVQVEIAPSRDSNGEFSGWMLVFSDITYRKHAERELRAIPSRLIAAQEEERKRLAGELHDSIGQTLAALKFNVELAILSLKEKGDTQQALNHLEQFVPTLQRSIDETRSICSGLRPKILEEKGIISTLQWFCTEFMKLYPTQHVELEVGVEERQIPEDLKVVIFRITQEALTNAARHSKAGCVDVSIVKNGGGIELTVSDDGVGMDLTYILENSTARSFGLTVMRERAQLHGGRLSIQSTPGEGTKVWVQWPDAVLQGESKAS